MPELEVGSEDAAGEHAEDCRVEHVVELAELDDRLLGDAIRDRAANRRANEAGNGIRERHEAESRERAREPEDQPATHQLLHLHGAELEDVAAVEEAKV